MQRRCDPYAQIPLAEFQEPVTAAVEELRSDPEGVGEIVGSGIPVHESEEFQKLRELLVRDRE